MDEEEEEEKDDEILSWHDCPLVKKVYLIERRDAIELICSFMITNTISIKDLNINKAKFTGRLSPTFSINKDAAVISRIVCL